MDELKTALAEAQKHYRKLEEMTRKLNGGYNHLCAIDDEGVQVLEPLFHALFPNGATETKKTHFPEGGSITTAYAYYNGVRFRCIVGGKNDAD